MARTPDTCPHCGAELPRRARACPECGADERTGWSEAAGTDRLGLPGDPEEFDHDAWVRSEFGDAAADSTSPSRQRRRNPAAERAQARRRFWAWVAVGLLAAMAAAWFSR